MPTAPTLADVKAYDANVALTYTDPQIAAALAAEMAAQARVCRLPMDPVPASPLPYPADLAEALCRRVVHNLALRGLPLGIQANIADGAVATTRVGGTDAEVRRLEAPFKRLVLG